MATPLNRLENWDEFEAGAVLRSFADDKKSEYSRDHSIQYSVADWRVDKPVFNRDLCIDCDQCWIYCPDTCFIVEEEVNKRGKKQAKITGISYDQCKGCGICVEVCPTPIKSLLMFPGYTDTDEALSQWPTKDDMKKEK